MNFVYCALLFALFYFGLLGLLAREKVKTLIGLGLLSLGINLFLFFSGGTIQQPAPFVTSPEIQTSGMTDPLPQALILTAIVIGFGLLIFTATLLNFGLNAHETESEKKADKA